MSLSPFEQNRITHILNAESIVITEEHDDFVVVIKDLDKEIRIPMFFFPDSETDFNKVLETYFDPVDTRPVAALGGIRTIIVTNGKCILIFGRTGVVEFDREVFLTSLTLVGANTCWRREYNRMWQDEDNRRDWLSFSIDDRNHISAEVFCSLFTQNLIESDFSVFQNSKAVHPEVSDKAREILDKWALTYQDITKVLLRHCFVRSIEPPKIPLEHYKVKWREGDIEEVKWFLKEIVDDGFVIGASKFLATRVLILGINRLRYLDDRNRSKAASEIFDYMSSEMGLSFEFVEDYPTMRMIRKDRFHNTFKFFE